MFGRHVFFRHHGVFFFIGNGFFSPFFFEPVIFAPIVPNPFCPFCSTGRILKFPGAPVFPFAPRIFFNGFFPTFGPQFGTAVFFAEAPMMPQAPAGPSREQPTLPPAEAVPGAEQPAAPEAPLTVLVFQDGSVYHVTDYWLDENRWLHYVTTWGAESSVPLELVNLYSTVNANAERGIEFVLRTRPRPQ